MTVSGRLSPPLIHRGPAKPILGETREVAKADWNVYARALVAGPRVRTASDLGVLRAVLRAKGLALRDVRDALSEAHAVAADGAVVVGHVRTVRTDLVSTPHIMW